MGKGQKDNENILEEKVVGWRYTLQDCLPLVLPYSTRGHVSLITYFRFLFYFSYKNLAFVGTKHGLLHAWVMKTIHISQQDRRLHRLLGSVVIDSSSRVHVETDAVGNRNIEVDVKRRRGEYKTIKKIVHSVAHETREKYSRQCQYAVTMSSPTTPKGCLRE